MRTMSCFPTQIRRPSLPALTDVATVEDGRRFRTPATLTQSALDGVPLTQPSIRRLEWGLEIQEARRRFHAYPSQPTSFGLLGCPGCRALGMLGGVVVDLDPR